MLDYFLQVLNTLVENDQTLYTIFVGLAAVTGSPARAAARAYRQPTKKEQGRVGRTFPGDEAGFELRTSN
jgi:hypothetical protein